MKHCKIVTQCPDVLYVLSIRKVPLFQTRNENFFEKCQIFNVVLRNVPYDMYVTGDEEPMKGHPVKANPSLPGCPSKITGSDVINILPSI